MINLYTTLSVNSFHRKSRTNIHTHTRKPDINRNTKNNHINSSSWDMVSFFSTIILTVIEKEKQWSSTVLSRSLL